jgi:hypothetical protein
MATSNFDKKENSMNNPLLDEIRAAYKATDLSPICCTYFLPGSACPLTVLAIGRSVVDKNDATLDLEEEKQPVFAWACDEFGEMWVYGFLNGFDEKKKTTNDSEYIAGYALGRQVRKQVFRP